jgi:Flp pilus assembly protein TadD
MVRLIADRQDTQRARITARDLYINQASNSPDALMTLGRSFQREGLDEFALESYQRAQSLAPNSAPIHKQLGYFYLAKNDRVRAETHLRRSFEIDPNQPDIASELGRMGVRVQVPPRKATGLLGPIMDAVSGEPQDETLK